MNTELRLFLAIIYVRSFNHKHHPDSECTMHKLVWGIDAKEAEYKIDLWMRGEGLSPTTGQEINVRIEEAL